jgi:hypothetical protein
MSIRSDVFAFLDALYSKSFKPEYCLNDVYARFPKESPNSVRTYANQWRDEKLKVLNIEIIKRVKKDKSVKSPTAETLDVPIDESFKKLIAYHHYAAEQGVEVAENVILSFLDKTDQLLKAETEVILYEDMMTKIQTFFVLLHTQYLPKPGSVLERAEMA